MKLPSIPSRWSWRQVAELGGPDRPAVKAGPFGSALKKSYYVSAGYRIYGQEQVIAGDLTNGDYYIDEERFNSLRSCEVRTGDILVSLVGSFGKTLVVPDKFEPGIINPRLVRLSLDSEAIDPYFFVHFFKSPFAQLQMQMESHGGTMGILNAKNISELAVPVPPLPEQRRIAAILDKADAIRPKRQETIRLTEDLLRSAFLDMFGDPVTNPKGWPVQQLGDHLKFVTSGSRGWAKYYAPSGSRFVRSLDVQMNRISDEDVVYVQPPDSAESARTKVEAGDVLLTITGSRIGRVAPVPKDLGAAHISQHVAILRLGPGLLPGFLSLFMSLPSGGQRQIQQMQYGQTKPGLNLQQARAFQVPCPPLELQRRFMKVWEVLNGLKKHIGLTHCSEADLRGSLVKRAFRGGL